MQPDGRDQAGLIWLRIGTRAEISSNGSWSLVLYKMRWIPVVAKKRRFLLQGATLLKRVAHVYQDRGNEWLTVSCKIILTLNLTSLHAGIFPWVVPLRWYLTISQSYLTSQKKKDIRRHSTANENKSQILQNTIPYLCC